MAALEKMRKRMGGFITVLIAIALLFFIVDADTLQSAFSMFSNKYDVGKINGKAITSQDYQKKYDYYSKIYEITTGNVPTGEEVSDMIHDNVWQNEIAERVLIPACENAGIGVGGDELLDMSQGVNISPVILSSFSNPDGSYNKDRFLDFINNIQNDASGSLQTYWDFLQDNMYKDRMFSKYTTLLEKSDIANNLQVKRDISESNIAYNVDFVIQPVAFNLDSTITVSDSEIKNYYNRIKESLYQIESRDADLIAFEIEPSAQDIQGTKEDIERLYPEFQATEDKELQSFLYKNSSIPYEGDFYKKGDLAQTSSELDDFVANGAVGAYFAPHQSDNNFVAAKIVNRAMVPDSLFVRYIPVGTDVNVADSVIKVLNGGKSFAEVATDFFPEEYQQQLPADQILGEMGWISYTSISNSLPKEFKKLFNTKVGEFVKFSVNGNNIIAQVTKTSKPISKAQVAILSKEAVASADTYSDIYNKANSFVVECGKSKGLDNFIKVATEEGYNIIPVNNIAGGQRTLHNYQNMSEVTRWIYNNKVGDVSNVIAVDNKYFFVAAITKISPTGYAPLEQVSSFIKSQIELEKKVDKLANEAIEKVGNNPISLEEIAEKYNTSVSSNEGITFSSTQSYGQLDPKFIGAIVAEGEKGNNNIVGPVKGGMGIYYFQIKSKENGAFYSEEDAATKRSQISKSVMSVLPQIMSQGAKAENFRYKFY